MLKKQALEYMENGLVNLFISTFTMDKLKNLGLKTIQNRDILFHNCINLELSQFVNLSIEEDLVFTCIARDVPHKNLKLCVQLVELINSQTQKKCKLFMTSEKYTSKNIEIHPVKNISDSEREGLYRKSHFNLLLSSDCSQKGYFEGFGLTCLEAGKYGTPSIVLNEAGLTDNIHDLVNGVKIENIDLNFEVANKVLPLLDESTYLGLREKTFDHTTNSHGIKQYGRLFKCLVA